MQRLGQRGFHVIEALIIVLVVGAIGFVGWRVISSKSGSDASKQSKEKRKIVPPTKKPLDGTKPVLKNLGGVTLAAYNPATKLAGDVEFNRYWVNTDQGMSTTSIFFGQQVPSHRDRTKTVANPNFTFAGLKTAVDVTSPIDGLVIEVKSQPETNDSEVMLWTKVDSAYVIGMDHVTDVAVKRGDKVTAGQTLGKAAPENNGSYRYELQINNEQDNTIFLCPTDFLANNVKQTLGSQIDQLAKDWDAWWGSSVYPAMTNGCVVPQLTLSEVEQ